MNGFGVMKVSRSMRDRTDIVITEIEEGQPCLNCEGKCSGFEFHKWRKTCSNCKCPKEVHDIYHEEWVNVKDRLGFKCPDSEKKSSREHLLEGYTWVPPGISSHKIEQYFRCLPQNKIPKIGTAGEKYRDKQLVYQLPKQDLALSYCKNIEPKDHQSYEDFINARNEIALDIAYVKECSSSIKCAKCKQLVEARSLGILGAKFGDSMLWHPDCFVCCECNQLLIDLTYCVHDDKLYCERHYAEQLKPRCAACDELRYTINKLSYEKLKLQAAHALGLDVLEYWRGIGKYVGASHRPYILDGQAIPDKSNTI